jgi:hypothetical protein
MNVRLLTELRRRYPPRGRPREPLEVFVDASMRPGMVTLGFWTSIHGCFSTKSTSNNSNGAEYEAIQLARRLFPDAEIFSDAEGPVQKAMAKGISGIKHIRRKENLAHRAAYEAVNFIEREDFKTMRARAVPIVERKGKIELFAAVEPLSLALAEAGCHAAAVTYGNSDAGADSRSASFFHNKS